jgi:hypothetical protein
MMMEGKGQYSGTEWELNSRFLYEGDWLSVFMLIRDKILRQTESESESVSEVLLHVLGVDVN